MAAKSDAIQTVQVVEIRARYDRNRLLGTFDPARGVLRLYHRGETVTVCLTDLVLAANKPIDLERNVE